MSKSDYLELALLDHIFGGGNYARPGTVYIALFTAAPNDAGGGTEVAGNSYARAAVTNDATHFPAASGGSKANGVAINFATPTGSWGTITHFAIFDALTSGNMLYWGAMSSSIAVGLNNAVTIPIGNLTITED